MNDLHTMLYHGWNYLTMIEEVFSIKNNAFQYSEDPNSPDVKTYEIDFKEDPILNENAFKRFDEACENVNKSFDSWKKEYDKINSSTSAGISDISSALTSAMDALPAMTEKKKKVDMHVQIASKILSEIKRRDLDKLQDFEDEIMKSTKLSNQCMIDLMAYLKNQIATPEHFTDRMRILTIIAICLDQDDSVLKQAIANVKDS